MATIKQRKAMMNAVENGGNISRAMIEAKYSPATAKNPKKLTESKAWQDLMEEYLPDLKLAQVHAEGLEAFRIKTSLTEPDQVLPDFAVRHKYLETGYKLKKRLSDFEIDSSDTPINVNIVNIIGKIYKGRSSED